MAYGREELIGNIRQAAAHPSRFDVHDAALLPVAKWLVSAAFRLTES